ncbi:hypothetical protein ACQP1V_00755 [Microtetraspora malaysiensis]|uniref:hypothetical protein n=1 Tax=Microtetraspora malaysiensis TaxID=161358 RepID=UPI003D8E6538
MPEAVISYVGEMPYRPGGIEDLHPFVPCLQAKMGDELLFKVWVQLSFEGSINATRRLEGQGLPTDAANQVVSQALVRYGVGRLEQFVTEHLSAGSRPAGFSEVWRLTTEDVPQLLALVEQKTCDYQMRMQRDLFCTAAIAMDVSRVGRVNGRNTAPTSRTLCQSCALPGTQIICSHLMHPNVTALLSGARISERHVINAMCDRGMNEVRNVDGCQAGGHGCWQRIAAVESLDAPPVSPLELAEAFDVLDAVWRLAFDKKKPLLSLSTVATPAALSLSCTTRVEFETRISDLADLIDRIRVDDLHLKPRSEEDLEKDKDKLKASLNRIEDCLHYHLERAQHAAVDRAIKTLRTIRQARNAEQHGITEGGGLTAKLRDLGIYDAPPNWGGAWDAVRARAVEALTTLRHELMTYVNAP